jgi:arylsulfatase A-like enzyme
MPTLLGLLHLPIPSTVEGMDCSHVARGQEGAEPSSAFLQNTGACAAWEDGFEWRGMRDKRFIYAVYRRDGAEFLFDNIADPFQLQNLASHGRYGTTLRDFRNALSDKMHSIQDTFESCTWYRDNWMKNRVILKSATMDAGNTKSGRGE